MIILSLFITIITVNDNVVAAAPQNGVTHVYTTNSAFAALKEDGSVITWGDSYHGGDSSKVSEDLGSGVKEIFPTRRAFAALKEDGSVVTWGGAFNGGDSSFPVSSNYISTGIIVGFFAIAVFCLISIIAGTLFWFRRR